MKKMSKSFLIIMVSFLMIFNSVLGDSVFATEETVETIDTIFESTLNQETNTETVTMNVLPTEGITIDTITLPDGSEVTGSSVEYTSNVNQEVSFIVNYTQLQTNSDGVVESVELEKTETFSFTKIKEETLEEPTVVSSNPRVLDTIITVEDANPTVWENDVTKTITVYAEFPENNMDAKTLTVNLAEGLEYRSVEVPSTYTKPSNVDTSIVSYLPSGLLNSATLSATVPAKESRSYRPATFGDVVYTISPTTDYVTYTFTVAVDSTRYYGEHDIANALTATVTCGEDSSTDSTSIKATGNVVTSHGIDKTDVSKSFREFAWQTPYSSEVYISEGDYVGEGSTRRFSSTFDVTSSNGTFIPTTSEFTVYYPVGMDFQSVVYGSTYTKEQIDNNTGIPSNLTITYDDTTGTVVLKNTQQSTAYISVNYTVPADLTPGEYPVAGVSKSTFTTYDGTVFSDIPARQYTSNDTIIAIDTVTVKKLEDASEVLTFKGYTTYIESESDYTYIGRIDDKNTSTIDSKPKTVTLDICSNFNAKMVRLPAPSIADVENIVVETTLGRTINVNVEDVKYASNRIVIDANTIGLAADEYIKSASADVGVFKSGYISSNSGGNTYYRLAYGQVIDKNAETYVDVTITTTGETEGTKATSKAVYTPTRTTIASMSAAFKNGGSDVSFITAGEAFDLEITNVKIFDYPYGTLMALQDPHVYIRESYGYTIDVSSIEFTDAKTDEHINANLITTHEYVTDEGVEETVYVFQLQDFLLANATNYPIETTSFDISMSMSTDISISKTTSYGVDDIIGVGGDGVTGGGTGYSTFFMENGVDLNNTYDESNPDEADKNDKIPSIWNTSNKSIEIQKNTNVVVETFLSVQGQTDPVEPYNPTNPNTVVNFTPGTNADYTINLANQSAVAADNFIMYVPIPKAGDNFGLAFQDETFLWNMQLTNEIELPSAKYSITYTSDATETNYADASIYGEINDSLKLEDVNMVRIEVSETSGGVLESGEEATIKVPLKVNEVSGTEETEARIGTQNIYNPYYYVSSSVAAGSIKATRVATELVIAQISGIAFEDKNANGVFDILGSEALEGQRVSLYIENTAGGYQVVTHPAGHDYVTTDSDGQYIFGEDWNLSYGSYKVVFEAKENHKFVPANIGLNDLIDSDVDVNGIIEDVDPTKLVSRSIFAGSIEYADTDYIKANLNVLEMFESTSQEITLNKTNTLDTTQNSITPAHFDLIKSATNGYQWSVGDETKLNINSVSQTNGKVSLTSQSVSGVAATTTTLSLSLEDMYGTTGSDTSPVIIYDANANKNIDANNAIAALHATIEYDQAVALTNEQAIALTKAVGFDITNTTINTSVVTVNQTQLNAIKSVSRSGLSYPLTFYVGEISVSVVITVESDELPVISGLTKVTIPAGATYDLETGVTASDVEDSDLTTAIVYPTTDTSTLSVGTHYVDYVVTDSDDNTRTMHREIEVLTNTAPVIGGANDVRVMLPDVDSFDYLAGITVSDDHSDLNVDDIVITGTIQIPAVDSEHTSPITYTLTDDEGNQTTVTRNIRVTNYKPTISGLTKITIPAGATYDLETGVTASDVEDSDLTTAIVYPTTDTSTLSVGTHYVDYVVTDSDDNTRTMHREIEVLTNTAPVIGGANDVRVMLPDVDSFDYLAGITVSDDHSELSIDDVERTGAIQKPSADSEHTSTITYTVTDDEGNQATVTRDIRVTNYKSTISGLTKVTIPAGTVYDLETGVTANDYEDSDLTTAIVYPTTDTSTLSVGTHYVDYVVTDSDDNTSTMRREIEVLTNTAPVIGGANDVRVMLPDVDSFDYLAGITVSDDHSELSIDDVERTGTIQKPEADSEYTSTITYTVTDDEGNQTTVTRDIRVTNYKPTFSGLTKVTIPAGTVYDLETGVTANDYEDSDLTTAIVYPTTDTSTLSVGTHYVDYAVTDSDDNTTTMRREIEVLENTAPVIDGANDVDLTLAEALEFDLFDGVTVSDDHSELSIDDVELTGTIQVPRADNEITTQITYTLTDNEGNVTVIIRNIRVTNYKPTFSGLDKIIIPAGTIYSLEADVTASDNEDSDVTSSIEYPTVDTSTLSVGTHIVDYVVVDSDGNTTTVGREIEVLENMAPVMDGISDVTLTIKDILFFDYLEGITVSDDHDELTIEDIVVTKEIIVPTVGTESISKITYELSDAQGNITTKVRYITMTNYAPEISGLDEITINEGETYDLSNGVNAFDKEDNDITSNISYPNIDTSVLSSGQHTLEYSVEDNDGNITVVSRIINVTAVEVPVITPDNNDDIEESTQTSDENQDDEFTVEENLLDDDVTDESITNDDTDASNTSNVDQGDTEFGRDGNLVNDFLMYSVILVYIVFILMLCNNKRNTGESKQGINSIVTIALVLIQMMLSIVFPSNQALIIGAVFMVVIIIGNIVYVNTNVLIKK